MRALAANVHRDATQAETSGHGGWERRGRLKAIDSTAAGASEMHVLRVLVFGVCYGEAKYSLPIDRLVSQTDICCPVKNTVESNAIDCGEPIFARQGLYVAMTERLSGRLKKTQDPDARARHARSGGTDGRPNCRERCRSRSLHGRI